MSDKLMRFDPATGEERPYPSHAAQWRIHHGQTAWLFNPWTGERRHASDVGSDPHGLLIVPDGEHLKAAPEPATVAVDAGALGELREAMTKFRMLPESAISRPAGSVARERVMEAARRLLEAA